MTVNENKKNAQKKGFWGKLLEKVDKKLEEKSKKTSCCSPKDKGKGSSCC